MPVNQRVLYNPAFNSNTFNVVQWADLPINLDVSPLTGDLMKIINTTAVEASIENIINTYMGERPYSNMGTALQLRLFENSNNLEVEMIKNAVFLSLGQFESRIKVFDVDIQVNPDQNSYEMTIFYSLINTSTVLSVKIILQRNR